MVHLFLVHCTVQSLFHWGVLKGFIHKVELKGDTGEHLQNRCFYKHKENSLKSRISLTDRSFAETQLDVMFLLKTSNSGSCRCAHRSTDCFLVSASLKANRFDRRKINPPYEKGFGCFKLLSHQVVLGFSHVGIIRAQPALVDLQGAAVVIFHLLVFALILAQEGQVVQLLGHIWMVLPENLTTFQKQNILN